MNDKKDLKSRDSADDKIPVSFYISHETLEKIEDLLFYVKKRLPVEKRRKLNKSVLVEVGFKILVEEYNAKGEQSRLWKVIQESMQN